MKTTCPRPGKLVVHARKVVVPVQAVKSSPCCGSTSWDRLPDPHGQGSFRPSFSTTSGRPNRHHFGRRQWAGLIGNCWRPSSSGRTKRPLKPLTVVMARSSGRHSPATMASPTLPATPYRIQVRLRCCWPLLGRRYVPKLDRLVKAGRGQCFAIRTEHNGPHQAAVPLDPGLLFCRHHVPELDRPVIASRCQRHAVWTECYGTHAATVSLEGGIHFTHAYIPQFHSVVLTRRSNLSSVRTECHGPYVRVSLEGGLFLKWTPLSRPKNGNPSLLFRPDVLAWITDSRLPLT
jgi:hypothetical protein